MGIRAKLFWISFCLVVAVGFVSGIFLESKLESWLLDRLETELHQHAQSARELLTEPRLLTDILDTDIASIDATTNRLGEAMQARVTVVAIDGTVLGDSELDLQGIRDVDNHANRPEIIQAHAEGQGTSTRYSTTVQMKMMYVAVPIDKAACVRISVPLKEVRELVGRLRTMLLLAGLLGLSLALVTSWLASSLLSRTLYRVVSFARALAEGREANPIPMERQDELGTIAQSFNQMAEELARVVSTTTEQRNRFITVLEAMRAGVIGLDSDGRVFNVNTSASQMLELPSDVMGKKLTSVLSDSILLSLNLKDSEKQQEPRELELSGPPQRIVLFQRTPLRTGGGQVLLLHEITDLRRLENLRRDFVANVSHELRTPVSVIRANVETLLDGALEDPEQALIFLNAIHRNSERLGKLITDLLDLSRIESGVEQLDTRPVLISAAAQRAIDSVSHRSQAKNITLQNLLDPTQKVLADPNSTDHILANLVDNAVKYTQEGGEIVLRSRMVYDVMRIEVADNGPGINPEHRARLFERFYRVDPGRSRAMGGTGLGLSIVKHLATAMGATVGMAPNTPKGSVFWFGVKVQKEAREQNQTD